MPSAPKPLLTGFLAASVALLASAGTGLAQAAPEGQAMKLTVRPSSVEAEANEARARQERLLKRMERSDLMIRSICISCGDQWKHQIYAPFNPLASLNPSSRTADQSGN